MTSAATLKVLIVDDQRSLRALLRASLLDISCRNVEEAEDGEEALRKMHGRPPDLVISDLNMPKLDGLGLLKAVRSSPNLQGVGFIMLTSKGDAHLVQEAIKLKVNNYLMKPFTLQGLRAKIEAVIGPLT